MPGACLLTEDNNVSMKIRISIPVRNDSALSGLVSALAGLAACAFLSQAVQAQSPQYNIALVEALGDPTPGGGAFSADFEPTRLNNRGQLAFTAEPAVAGNEGVFIADDAGLTEVMRWGDAAPGGGTFAAGELGDLGLNDRGDVALTFQLEPAQFDPFIHGGVYYYSARRGLLFPVLIPGVTPAPDGGTLLGSGFNVTLNNRGTLSFTAFASTPDGDKPGVYVADCEGHISVVARHGTPLPGGQTVDSAYTGSINDRGDVAFQAAPASPGAVAGDYVRWAATGHIEAIASPAGTGGANGDTQINNRGEVLFGENSPGAAGLGVGSIYLYTAGRLVRVAGVGDPAPGGGEFSVVTGSQITGQAALNNRGEATFCAATTTGDEEMLLYSRGTLQVVAHVGTVIPGVGTIYALEQSGQQLNGAPLPPLSGLPVTSAAINDRGQIGFAAVLEDGRNVLLLASPMGTDDNEEYR